jgi:Co/Zn/Cd efflux system component
MYLAKDRCELKRVKRKPFLKILSDIFINKTNFFALCFFILYYVLLRFLIGTPFEIEWIIISSIIAFLVFTIMKYYERHMTVTVLTDNIKKMYVNKSRKILRIKYIDFIGRMRIMAIDMPDNEHEQQYLINQLNERNLFVIDKSHSLEL